MPRGVPAGRWRWCRRRARMNDSSGVAGMPISARDRQVTASSNQTFSTKVACFTRPSSVVREGTSDRRACSSVSPSRQPLSALRCSSRNTSNWARAGWSMTSSADVAGRKGMSGAFQNRQPKASQRSTARAGAHAAWRVGRQWPDTTRRPPRAVAASRSASLHWLLQETLGGGSTGGGKSRVWFAAEGCVSSAVLPSAVRWRQLVCQSGRSGLACSQSTNVASSQ